MSNQCPFPKRLKEARKAIGLSQEKLGIEAGIDELSASARMNQYEKGKHVPDYDMASRIANVLKLPVAYFYAADDDLAKLILGYYGLMPEDKLRMLSSITTPNSGAK
ncbi:MAG: helix-turn-helix transcriptional regulator [Colwellia sp.]|jgi:Helix-turn-helix.